MKRLFVVVLLIGFGLEVDAQQFPSEFWHEGKVVTIERDTIRGLVKYNLQIDIVQVEYKNRIITISAQKLYYFEIFDKTVNNFRYFYALPFANSQNYEVPMLFEVLHEGKMSLLTREKIVSETVSTYSYYSPNLISTEMLAYDYFFLREKGELQRYHLKKNELESTFMRDHGEQVKKFMKKNRLKFDRKADLVRIVYFYNTLI